MVPIYWNVFTNASQLSVVYHQQRHSPESAFLRWVTLSSSRLLSPAGEPAIYKTPRCGYVGLAELHVQLQGRGTDRLNVTARRFRIHRVTESSTHILVSRCDGIVIQCIVLSIFLGEKRRIKGTVNRSSAIDRVPLWCQSIAAHKCRRTSMPGITLWYRSFMTINSTVCIYPDMLMSAVMDPITTSCEPLAPNIVVGIFTLGGMILSPASRAKFVLIHVKYELVSMRALVCLRLILMPTELPLVSCEIVLIAHLRLLWCNTRIWQNGRTFKPYDVQMTVIL